MHARNERGQPQDTTCCPVTKVSRISSSIYLRRWRKRAAESPMLPIFQGVPDIFLFYLFEKTKEDSWRIPPRLPFFWSASDIQLRRRRRIGGPPLSCCSVSKMLLKSFSIYLRRWKRARESHCCVVSKVPRISFSIFRKDEGKPKESPHVALFLKWLGHLRQFIWEDGWIFFVISFHSYTPCRFARPEYCAQAMLSSFVELNNHGLSELLW